MIQIIQIFEKVVVCRDLITNQFLLKSAANFSKGEVISLYSSKKTLKKPSYLTVQISRFEHILLHPSYLQYINHSCSPNVYFNTSTFQLIALKNIKKEDELRYFYPSTEWDMIQPFDCNCLESSCLGKIKGAKYLSIESIEKYQFSSFIKSSMLYE